jgi:hypothetical protein
MATTIVTKYGSDAPAATDIVRGELAVDTENGRLYTENAAGAVVEIGLKPEGNVNVTGSITADGLTVGDTSDSQSLIQMLANSTNGANTIHFGDGTSADAYVGYINYAHDSNSMQFAAGGSERMRIDSSGRVSIGRSSDVTAKCLELQPPAQISDFLSYILNIGGDEADDAVGTKSGIGFGYTSTARPAAPATIGYETKNTGGGTYGDIYFATRSTGGTEQPTERMRITSAGALQLSDVNSPNDINTAIYSNSDVLEFEAFGTNGAIAFSTGSGVDERMRIDSAGNTSFTLGTNAVGTFNDAISEVGSGNFALQVTNSAGSALKPLGFRAEDIRFATGSAERMRIDSNGNLLVSTSSDFASGTVDGIIAQGTNKPAAAFSNTEDGQVVKFYKSSSLVGSIGTINDSLYIASPYSTDSGLRFSASIVHPCTTTGEPRDNAIDLGYSAARFDDIYATNGTIQTSDQNEKQDIAELSDAEQRVAVAAKGLLRKFRWKSSVEEKGDEARTHFGIIAQDLQAAFAAEGLDAGDYAMFINSTWTDEETGEERSRMGVRYSELLAFIIAAI